jgi:AcrR family transcriptional regulator
MPESKPKRTRDPERTREAILDAARDVFATEGYERATVRKVAERAGVTHGTIYLYFRDKDDLLYQLSEEHYRELLARLRTLPRTVDVVTRIRDAYLAVVDYGLELPEHHHLMLSMRPPHMAVVAERRFGPMAEEVYGFLCDTIRRAMARGRIVPGSVDHVALALVAAAHGFVELYRSGMVDVEEARETARRAVEALLRGLEPRR